MNCATCVYFETARESYAYMHGLLDLVSGECRRHGPEVNDPTTTHHGIVRGRLWPITIGDEWCGDYAAMPKAAAVQQKASMTIPELREQAMARLMAAMRGDTADPKADELALSVFSLTIPPNWWELPSPEPRPQGPESTIAVCAGSRCGDVPVASVDTDAGSGTGAA